MRSKIEMGAISRRAFLRLSAVTGVGAVLAACGQAAPAAAPTTAPAAAAPTTAPAAAAPTAPAVLPAAPAPGPIDLNAIGGMDKLVEAAKAEGALSVIALPNDWANYGEMKKAFSAKYPFIKIEDLNPDGSSAQEVEAIKANAGSKGPQAPDVIDVGFTWGDTAKQDKVLQPYKVATWAEMPDALKDAEGYWYGDYYGVMTFEVNTQVVKNVPQDWSDLLKPEYKGQVALAGDPTGSGQAINAVWAAALGNGGSLDNPAPGLDFFKKLNDAGNFVPVIAKPATIAKGETPIALRWDYNALANRDATAGNPDIAVVVPKSGSLAGVYVQGISAYSPRPHAARLWMEFLYSDEGQLIWLKGYASPARFDAMKKASKVPADLIAKLPKYDAPVGIPTGAQINKAVDAIKAGWTTVVGATVK
jgi:putative spermidine/putrescine transport system substrate-binding protein